jgi:hypothetical protein
MLNTEITFLPNVRRPGNFSIVTLRDALLQIKKGKYQKPVEAARLELLLGDDEEYRRLKGELPSYSFQATYKTGGKVINADFEKSTGLFVFDLDKLSRDAFDKATKFIRECPHTVFSFQSPSGDGIKGAFKVNPVLINSDADYKVAFTQVERFFAASGLKLDGACKDVRRVAFTSYDVGLFYNKKSTTFPLVMSAPVVEEEGYVPLSDDDDSLPLPDINTSNAAKYLPPADTVTDYAAWMAVGAILHHQFSGGEDGLEIFDVWSQGVQGYKDYADVAKQWYAFKRSTGKVATFKTLVKQYNERRTKDFSVADSLAFEKAERLIESCIDYMVLARDVAPKLWRLADRNVALEKDFLTMFVDRYFVLHGVRLDKTSALRAMRMNHKKDVAEMDVLNGPNTPAWAKNWVWVGEDEKFINVATRVILSSNGFRSMFNSNLPKAEGAPVDISAMVRDERQVPKVMRSMYAPKFSALFDYAEVTYVNTYSEIGRAVATGNNKAAVDIFLGHIAKICGGYNREYQLLCNFLACCIGGPPTKVRWAPLLIGTFGDGKSLFHKFVSLAIGLENTRSVSCSTIISATTTGFSGWAKGVCFILVDELKLHGHNRNDVINSLKTYQTDDVVPCMLKGKEAGQMVNAANFWFNSNFRDAVPVEEGNRRLMVLHSKLDMKKEGSEYFDTLHSAIDTATGDIVQALIDIPFHADFKPNGHAPMTDAKVAMIKLSKDDLIEQIEDILNEGHPHYSEGVIVFDSLYMLMSSGYDGLKLDSAYKLTAALTSMGFLKLGRESINNQRHCLWGRDVDGEIPTSKWAKKEVIRKSKNFRPVDELI